MEGGVPFRLQPLVKKLDGHLMDRPVFAGSLRFDFAVKLIRDEKCRFHEAFLLYFRVVKRVLRLGGLPHGASLVETVFSHYR